MKNLILLKARKKQVLFFIILLVSLLTNHQNFAQVTFLENSKITDEALFFWKADDPKPFHFGQSINPHGNCMKVSNGYVFYTWYRGGWSDRTLMISRKKIGEGDWVHVALPAKMSLVGGKGDTHLTTNVGICSIDGTVHLMFDHHNEDLNYIRSKKNIAYASDSEFTAENFLPQQNFLIPGKKITSVTYPDLFNNDVGEMYFERRLGSAVGGDIIMTYYDGSTWSEEVTIIKGRGTEVSQGERHFAYGSAHFINGKFYYAYSPRWAESPTRLNEGVCLMELGERMNDKATTVNGKSYDLPIKDHAPFLVADPRSVPDNAGWAGGPQVAISPKNDVYMYIKPKGTSNYNYLKTANNRQFTVDRSKGSLGIFYGNRMYKFNISGGNFIVTSALAGTYDWREDFRKNIGISVKKSITIMNDGVIAVVFSEVKNSPEVPVHCFVFQLEKEEYTPQTISFDALEEKTEGDSDFALTATSSSGLPVSFKSSNTNIARIVDGDKVRIMGIGACEIIAIQKGDGTFDSAPNLSQTFTVIENTSKSNQTINFNLTTNTHIWGNVDEILSATSSSGLPIIYESTDTDVAVIIDGNKLHVKRAGKTTINALQSGNDMYNAAPIVSNDLTAPIRQQEIIFQDIPEVISGDASFNLIGASNNPDANLRFVCPNNQVAVVWSNQVRHVLGAGTATVTVSDTGNEYFTSAQASKIITVKPKTHVIPTEIEAEYYTTKRGVNVTRWSNSIFYLNSWNVDDFAEYTIDVPNDGVYDLEVFAAATSASKKLKIIKGTTILKSVTLNKTPNLTRFLGTKTTIRLQKGIQKIKVVGEVAGFNFDRMKITLNAGDTEEDEKDDVSIYKIKNLETGKYLTSSGATIVASDTGEGADKEWTFTKVEANGLMYYNIDSEVRGILRAAGEGLNYSIINTTKAPPTTDVDKIWSVHYNESDNTYRFEAKDNNRFLYHQDNDEFYNIAAELTDARSKWVLETNGVALSTENRNVDFSGIKIYPNPTKGILNIKVPEFLNVLSLDVYNVQGGLVKSKLEKVVNGHIRLDFTSIHQGVYFIKINLDKPVYLKFIKK